MFTLECGSPLPQVKVFIHTTLLPQGHNIAATLLLFPLTTSMPVTEFSRHILPAHDTTTLSPVGRRDH